MLGELVDLFERTRYKYERVLNVLSESEWLPVNLIARKADLTSLSAGQVLGVLVRMRLVERKYVYMKVWNGATKQVSYYRLRRGYVEAVKLPTTNTFRHDKPA